MNKTQQVIVLALTFFTSLILLSMNSLEAAPKDRIGVILSTVDIDAEYEILGLVHYRSNELNLDKIHAELKQKAEAIGADYVVGITYFRNAGYLYGSGTAVKLIEEDEPGKP